MHLPCLPGRSLRGGGGGRGGGGRGLRNSTRYRAGAGRNEVQLRMQQLLEYASLNEYNLSSVQRFLQHDGLRRQIPKGIHLNPGGRRWDNDDFMRHTRGVYKRHHVQTVTTRARLMRRWTGAPLLGSVGVWDLLHLLHFTIDHGRRAARLGRGCRGPPPAGPPGPPLSVSLGAAAAARRRWQLAGWGHLCRPQTVCVRRPSVYYTCAPLASTLHTFHPPPVAYSSI